MYVLCLTKFQILYGNFDRITMEEVFMKSVSYYFTYVLSGLLMIGLTLPALSQGEKEDDLIGHWTFENGVELEDHTGHFGDIELRGAKVKDGKLHQG